MTQRLVSFVLLWSATAWASSPLAERIESSESCGACHRTIYRTWRDSAHARSMESETFLQAYRETEQALGKKQSRVCLGCHAPLIELNGDRDLELRVTWEGVSCEVCHSLVSVDISDKGPRHTLDPGPVKHGPIRDAASTAHEVAYSELHATSLACAWCHEYVSPEGTAILTTYSEWKRSEAAAAGRTCQTCHMGLTAPDPTDPRSERESGAAINLHHVPGGHSLDQLHQALGLGITPRREGDELVLELTVRNKGAGHAVPTGMPGRRVILELTVATSQGARFEERRTYGKSFVGATGAAVIRDRDYFVPGVKLDSDTRILPDERRSEIFRLPVPESATAYVEVKLHYEHAPMGGEQGRTWLTFLSEKRTVTPTPSP